MLTRYKTWFSSEALTAASETLPTLLPCVPFAKKHLSEAGEVKVEMSVSAVLHGARCQGRAGKQWET